MKTVKTLEKQTVLDLAMQYYGNIEAIDKILELNPDLINDSDASADRFYIDAALLAGQDVNIDEDSDLMKKNVIRHIVKPVTTYDRDYLQPSGQPENKTTDNNNPVITDDYGKNN